MPRRKPTTLTHRQALLVRELAYTPGNPVTWPVLADAIGEPATARGKFRVDSHIQNIRAKFGRDAILGERGHGYYLPKGWERR